MSISMSNLRMIKVNHTDNRVSLRIGSTEDIVMSVVDQNVMKVKVVLLVLKGQIKDGSWNQDCLRLISDHQEEAPLTEWDTVKESCLLRLKCFLNEAEIIGCDLSETEILTIWINHAFVKNELPRRELKVSEGLMQATRGYVNDCREMIWGHQLIFLFANRDQVYLWVVVQHDKIECIYDHQLLDLVCMRYYLEDLLCLYIDYDYILSDDD